jgi:aryl-alcohol dehydrogenase-like predicted oxidoreductase
LRVGRDLSVIGLGTWQLGADWGEVGEREAKTIVRTAVEEGVTFIDTADVYGDGRSETIIGAVRAELGDRASELVVATKMGRRVAQEPAEFHIDAFRTWTDRSRRLLGMDTLDLVQLHCPPASVVTSDAVYDALDTLVDEGRIRAYGISVETCDEALAAIDRPHVASVQIILNPFRLKPLERVVPAAAGAGIAIIARVPLASGLLTGKFRLDSTFAADDHRSYNRSGDAFDVGETFSGVDFATGVAAAEEFARLAPPGVEPAQLALRWIVQQHGVTTVIPGATSVRQVHSNVRSAALPALDSATLSAISELYDRRIRPTVHDRW